MAIQTALDSISQNQGSPFGFKNRIINGGMVIDQRNVGASLTPGEGSYSSDRWKCRASQASKYTIRQMEALNSGASNYESGSAPPGFKNSLKITSSSSYSVGSTDQFYIEQYIEGLNSYDLQWGTTTPSTVTLSFWVKSSLTGTFGGAIRSYQSAPSACYPIAYTINQANTWEQKSITIPGVAYGTWVSTNSGNIVVSFSIGSGSSWNGTASAWAATEYYSSTGATNLVGTNAATWYITGVQLEKGNQATSFDYRPFTTELALCQRYYERRQTGGAYYGVGISGTWATTTLATTAVNFAVPKRTSSSVNGSNLSVRNGGSILAITSYSGTYSSGTGQYGYIAGALDVGVSSGGTAGYGATITDNSTGTGYIEFSSEL